MKKTKKKLRGLQFLSWTFLLAPITGVIAYNFGDYFSQSKGLVFNQSVDVGIGLTLSAICGVMLAVGKTNTLKGSKGLVVALLLTIFLKTILNDLILILSALSVGSVVFEAFKPSISTTKDIYIAERNAGINATAMKNVLNEAPQEIVRSGRV